MTETLVPPYLYAVTLVVVKTGPGQSGSGWASSVDVGACTLMTRAHSHEEAEGVGWHEMCQLYPEAAGWEKRSINVLAVTAHVLAGAQADPRAQGTSIDRQDTGHGEG